MFGQQCDLEEVGSRREKKLCVQIGDRHFLKANRETSGTSRHKAMFHICLLRAARSTDVTVLLISHAAFSYLSIFCV